MPELKVYAKKAYDTLKTGNTFDEYMCQTIEAKKKKGVLLDLLQECLKQTGSCGCASTQSVKKCHEYVEVAAKITVELEIIMDCFKEWWVCCQGGDSGYGCGREGFEPNEFIINENGRRKCKYCDEWDFLLPVYLLAKPYLFEAEHYPLIVELKTKIELLREKYG